MGAVGRLDNLQRGVKRGWRRKRRDEAKAMKTFHLSSRSHFCGIGKLLRGLKLKQLRQHLNARLSVKVLSHHSFLLRHQGELSATDTCVGSQKEGEIKEENEEEIRSLHQSTFYASQGGEAQTYMRKVPPELTWAKKLQKLSWSNLDEPANCCPRKFSSQIHFVFLSVEEARPDLAFWTLSYFLSPSPPPLCVCTRVRQHIVKSGGQKSSPSWASLIYESFLLSLL